MKKRQANRLGQDTQDETKTRIPVWLYPSTLEAMDRGIATIQESAAADSGNQDRLEQIQAIIDEREHNRTEYDDSIVRQMVECIKVYPGGRLEIIFGGGHLVEETV